MQIIVPFPLKSTHLGYKCTDVCFQSCHSVRRAICLNLSTCSGSLYSQHQFEAEMGPIWWSNVRVVALSVQKGACFGFCPVSPLWHCVMRMPIHLCLHYAMHMPTFLPTLCTAYAYTSMPAICNAYAYIYAYIMHWICLHVSSACTGKHAAAYSSCQKQADLLTCFKLQRELALCLQRLFVV